MGLDKTERRPRWYRRGFDYDNDGRLDSAITSAYGGRLLLSQIIGEGTVTDVSSAPARDAATHTFAVAVGGL